MFVLLTSLVLGTAEAAGKIRPYMNGIGLTAGTMVFPQKYPLSFPKYGEGDNKTQIEMSKVTGDAFAAFTGVLYVSKDYRMNFNPYYQRSFGDENAAGFSSLGVDFGVDKTFFKERNVLGFAGVNLGSARMKFDQEKNGTLNANRLYVQGQAGATYFNRTSAYELALFARFGITGVESYTLDGKDMGDLSGGVYSFPMVGIKASYFYGDFRAIHGGNNGGKKGGKKKRK